MITYEDAKKYFEYDPNTGYIICIYRKWVRRFGKVTGGKDANGYIKVCIFDKQVYAHRLAWLLTYKKWPKKHIDHINGITSDNRLVNLREADYQINGKNRKLSKRNKSGANGVHWHKNKKSWHTSIWDGKRQVFLGGFKDLNKAIEARKDAEIEYGFHKNHGRVTF